MRENRLWTTLDTQFRRDPFSSPVPFVLKFRWREQGWITSAHVRDLMTCVGGNGLGTIANLDKMTIETLVNETRNDLVKPPQVTLVCYPAPVRLTN